MQSLMEVETTFGWLVVVMRERAEWRCFMKESGALCVMTSGIVTRQKWYVDNLDSSRTAAVSNSAMYEYDI